MQDFFRFFQIVVLIIFFLVIGTKIYILRRSRINAIAVGRGKRGIQLVFELVSFTGFAVWMIEMLLYATHSDYRTFPYPFDIQLFNTAGTRYVGAVLIGAGLLVFTAAFVSFGNSCRIGFDTDKPGELVTTGIFAFSRNPIYLFIDLWFIGVFLINGNLIFAVLTGHCLVLVHRQVLEEEKFCANLYGRAYDEYRRKTRRYVTLTQQRHSRVSR